MRQFLLFTFLLTGLLCRGVEAPDYSAVDVLFTKYCLDCHAAQDPDAKLVLENFDALMKGSENGPVVVAGKSSESSLVLALKGTLKHNGKMVIMPPKKRAKLTATEIETVAAWIDAGAHAPSAPKTIATELNVPKVRLKGKPRNPINCLAAVPGANLIAVGRYREVQLLSTEGGALQRSFTGHHGNVNALAFSPDGKLLYAGGGETSLFGEVKVWEVATGKLVQTLLGHKDAVYALAVSPDGTILATGSYDQKIKLWDTATGKELKTLSGHNGCVYGLAFRPDGTILASASGDHTVKLWDVQSGARRDTLSQPLKEVYAVAFQPGANKLAAAGVDNRIRIYQTSSNATETTNPLLDSKFAAEGAILCLVFSRDGNLLLSSADDRTVRLWDFATMKQKFSLEKQPDWATGLAFTSGGKNIAVGRMDGSLAFYDLAGKMAKFTKPPLKRGQKMVAAPKPPSDKPEITRLTPRGMQFGTEIIAHAGGANLLEITNVKTSDPKFSVSIVPGSDTNAVELALHIKAAPDLPRGEYTFSLVNEKGTGAPVRFFIGHLPHVYETNSGPRQINFPSTYWGVLNPGGDLDQLTFHAHAGQTLVFDMAAKSLGSAAQTDLTLMDQDGRILASEGSYEGGDPLLIYTVTNTADYRLQITESTSAGAPEFYYRTTMGELPEVTGIFPTAVRTNTSASIKLTGVNLGTNHSITIHSVIAGETSVPLDMNQFRSRRGFNVAVMDNPVTIEQEPNDTPQQANPLTVPGTACGCISSPADVDFYRFTATQGQHLILETDAARRGSPVDTRIEVLSLDGSPIERLQLRAVRDSAINFRSIDSSQGEIRVDNWQEMELNQYLYLEGEVCRLFRAPQGPDSGFIFYTGNGRRRDYFDTSATDHALDQACYIVEPHAVGETLPPNGLPVFPVYYVNDDDSDRQIGVDSRLHFTAPHTGDFLVKVSDSRGHGGERYTYNLNIHEARPDFSVSLTGASPTLAPGTGREFAVSANRMDGFDGPIRVDITNIPAGFRISSPLVIEADHTIANGTIECDTNAMAPTAEQISKIKITSTAEVEGHSISKPVNDFASITLSGQPTLLVACEPYNEKDTNYHQRAAADPVLELTLAPGGTIPAWIKVQRKGHEELVTFTAANLPHGVIIDNIGLSGVLIPKEESRREIFLHSEGWVPDSDRLFFIKAAQAGEPTSLPVLLHMRHSALSAMK